MATKIPGKPSNKLIDELEDSLRDELSKITSGVDPETGKPYTLTSKSKVWDRILKLEAIKAKMNAGDWGEGFSS